MDSRQGNGNSTVQDCVQHSIESGYLDLSSSSEALYHFMFDDAFSTLWTQHNELYELHAHHIEQTALESPVHYTEGILHH
jgi:hypothetical protein